MGSNRAPTVLTISLTTAILVSALPPVGNCQDGQWIDPTTATSVLPYAYLAGDSYNEDPRAASIPFGYKRIETWQDVFIQAGLSSKLSTGLNAGFYATVYAGKNNEIVISYQGTNGPTDLKGLFTDAEAQGGVVPTQYLYAKELAALIRKFYPNSSITVTGHSKGGGEATYAGQQVPGINKVITFNAAGPPFLAGKSGATQINVAVPGELIGDPSTKSVLGPVGLPGKLVYVHSNAEPPAERPAPRATSPFAEAGNAASGISDNAKAVFTTDFGNEHQLRGMIASLDKSSAHSSNLLPLPNNVRSPAATSSGGNIVASTGSDAVISSRPRSDTTFPAPTASSFPSSFSAGLPSVRAVGGISLSKAAAARMPLNMELDASSVSGDKILLSGREASDGIDTALFLTALRAACDPHDPYFSLDADDGAVWLGQGQKASDAFWSRIKSNFAIRLPANGEKRRGANIDIRTISAARDYPEIWRDISPRFPNFKTRLVFYPEWLRETRFGEILYKADVLLKELSSGVSVLTPGKLRALSIDDYLSSEIEHTANQLLAGSQTQNASPPQWRGSRLWFDIAPAPATFANSHREVNAGAGDADPQLRSVLAARGYVRRQDTSIQKASKIVRQGNTLDLSALNPKMFVRVRDIASNQDLSDHDPLLDGLASDVTTRFDRYADTYDELRMLRDIFRAYIVAVQITDKNEGLCNRFDALPLLDAEKVSTPLPEYRRSEMFFTVGTYWPGTTTGRAPRSSSTSSVSGGVSIEGRQFASVATEDGETPITQKVGSRAAGDNLDEPDETEPDRRYVSLTLDSALSPGPQRVAVLARPGSLDRIVSDSRRADRISDDSEIENEPSSAKLPTVASNNKVLWAALILLVAISSVLYRRGRTHRHARSLHK